MAVSLDDSINRQTHGTLSWLLSRQTFWVFVAALLACIALTFMTDTFATRNNLFNVTRNFAFVGIVAATSTTFCFEVID